MFQIHFLFVLFFVLSCKFCTLFSSMYFFSLLLLPCASLFDSIRYHLLLYVIHYLSFVSVFRSEDNLIFSKHNNLWTALFLRSLSKELFVPQVQQTVHDRVFFRRRGGGRGGAQTGPFCPNWGHKLNICKTCGQDILWTILQVHPIKLDPFF